LDIIKLSKLIRKCIKKSTFISYVLISDRLNLTIIYILYTAYTYIGTLLNTTRLLNDTIYKIRFQTRNSQGSTVKIIKL